MKSKCETGESVVNGLWYAHTDYTDPHDNTPGHHGNPPPAG